MSDIQKQPSAKSYIPELSGMEKVRYCIYRNIAGIFENLSDKKRTALADCISATMWKFLRSRRQYTISAVQKHLELPLEEATRIARQSYTENWRSFLEIFLVRRFKTAAAIREVNAPEILQQFSDETAPIVLALAHIGPWELLAALVNDFSATKEKLVVVRSQPDKALDRLLKEMRSAAGMHVVGHRQASKVVLEELSKHHNVAGFLVDHNCNRKEAVFLPFFNDIAAVNAGPAMLALRSKAVVYPAYLLRLPGGGLALHLEPPLYTRDLEGSIGERVAIIAKYYSDCVEKVVRLYPEQWFWMHKRWKTREK